MDRQTSRDWVHRFNAEGVAGLPDRPHASGVRACLSVAQQEQVADRVQAGPALEKSWRRIDNERSINRLAGNQTALRRVFSHLGALALNADRASERDSNKKTRKSPAATA
jgi:hypothetical protein